MTGIPDGKDVMEWTRLIIVTLNPALTREAVMGVPKFPEADEAVSQERRSESQQDSRQ